jgi:cobalt-zinc-cadmium resistance protein CzcA
LGESNVLEKKNALIQQGQIVSQIIEIESTLTAARSTFNWMLQTENLYEPQADFYTKILVPTDSILPQNHPLLLKQLHQETIASAGIALEKAKLLPDFLLSYNNQSIQGTGADNITYNAGKRFHSVQAGIGIPISNSAQKARVNAAKTEVLIAQNNTEISKMELQNTINNTRISYDKQLSLVKYFEENALPQIYEIQKVADLQFTAGEINYLEWMMLTHQAVQTRSDYLEALRQLNHYSLQIQQLLQF